MQYLNFDLLIEPASQGFRAKVVSSPAGEADLVFTPPFSKEKLENFYAVIAGASASGSPGAPGTGSKETQAVKVFGGGLFESIFRQDVRVCLFNSLAEAERQQVGLRLRIRLGDAPELATQPWEYLYNQSTNRFLGIGTDTPLVRYLDMPEGVQPLGVKPPFRVLVAIASPDDYPPVDSEYEWTNLKNALSGLMEKGLLVMDRLDLVTPESLQNSLRQSEYHIFHFIGHGEFDESTQDGFLILLGGSGSGQPVSGEMLGGVLRNHRSLRLAVLNACEGARGAAGGPFAGVAQSLVQQGIPAVVAMQFALLDTVSITFAQEFYKSISAGLPVDAAVSEARRLIYFQGYPFEWGAPVLFMRSPDGAIFDLDDKQAVEKAMAGEEPISKQKNALGTSGKASSSADSPRAGGDMIIATIGSGASGVAVGKNIDQVITSGRDAEVENLEHYFRQVEEALHESKGKLDPGLASMAEFQWKLLKSELSKSDPGEIPSASAIAQVTDWLLENIPALSGPLAALFSTRAVFQRMSRAGDVGVKWLEERFKGRG